MRRDLFSVARFAAAVSALLVASAPSTATAAEATRAGEQFRDCGDGCPEMVVVPAGSFMMGAPDASENPQLSVAFAKPFAVGKFEVSFAEWEACVAAKGCSRTPDATWGKGQQPVVNVSWDDAQQYAAWLSRKTGKPYRLLSEAEWEYAARAGSTTLYSWGNEVGVGNANCDGCGSQWDGKQPAPVGSFKANAFGLHDMLGNVWEWVEDCWDRSLTGAPNDGSARTSDCADDNDRVQRGGGFLHDPVAVRSTVRNNYTRDASANGVGFRIARTL